MVLLGTIEVAALSAIVMLLWNLLIPEIFGLTVINFWQAAGLFILAKILFGGFGRRGMMMHGKHRENPIHAKWNKMTAEQRKEFIEKRRKFGFGGPFGRDHFDIDESTEHRKENE